MKRVWIVEMEQECGYVASCVYRVFSDRILALEFCLKMNKTDDVNEYFVQEYEVFGK